MVIITLKWIILLEILQTSFSKMANWKAPGPDNIHGYWWKQLSRLHCRTLTHLQDLLMSSPPDWMTTGKTVLIKKDKSKPNTPSNYRPITCLCTIWKIMTSIISKQMNIHLNANDILPEQQKGCREKTRGTKDQLLIDKIVLKESRHYKKIYILHISIIKKHSIRFHIHG